MKQQHSSFMNGQRQNFIRAWQILNSLFIPVTILFLVDILNLSFLFKFGFIYILLIKGALSIYCMSAIAGSILEIVSGQEFVFQFRRFNQNARELWTGFLVAFVSIRFMDILIFAPLPLLRIWRPACFTLMGTIAVYLLARWAFHKKYIKTQVSSQHALKTDLNFLPVIIAAFLIQIVLGRISGGMHTGHIYWHNIIVFVINYLNVFEFVYCSVFILNEHPEIIEKFNTTKEIFMINPIGVGIIRGLVLLIERQYPPFFVVLKAMSPKTYTFREFNRVIWQERYYKSNILVCITCFTSNSYEAYKLAKEFKKRGSTVVMGGPHVTYMPREALVFCDSVVIGQAEGIWSEIVGDYEAGKLKKQYKGPASEADYARVHEELLNSPPYMIKDFLEVMRGCKFRCHFCTIPALNGGEIHTQPINAFVELIRKLRPKYSQVTFLDNNIYNDPGYAKELFMALKPLKIKWFSSCSIDIGKNKDFLKLARESGCSILGIGFEISTGSVEKNQGGKFAMAQRFVEYSKNIKKAGISIKGQYIFGFDTDDLKALLRLWKSCFSIMPQFTALSLLTPLPGSGLYREMLGRDRIISLNWRSYTCYKLIVRHPHLDPLWMSLCFPFIQIFFFLTTSIVGYLFLTAALINSIAVLIGLMHHSRGLF